MLLTDGNNKFVNHSLCINLDIYKDENGKEWFKAQDISEFFGYAETKDMTRNLDSMEKHSCRHIIPTVQGNRYEAVFLDEYALYEIVLKIRKVDMVRYQKAQAFQDWVFGEVLPSLRKNKAYVDTNLMISEDELQKAIDAAMVDARKEIARNQEQISFLKSELAEAEHRETMDYMLEPMLADFKEELDHQRYRYNKLESDYEKLKKIVESYMVKEVNEMRQRNGLPNVDPENKTEFLREFENARLKKSILDIFPIDVILSKV